ncbi:cellulose synthase subunit BcsC-related outer membrane protein [Spongiibacter marinus]|uniref:cellulose synthase subunit BcsC-related outer membrane protein n=1 Tax=Spongiibacter marinus TaxID=354246 RepID=UPI0013771800|nr:cellulose synthase subunit BcsC-related outer membrane protein [Spongiibacter marinus]
MSRAAFLWLLLASAVGTLLWQHDPFKLRTADENSAPADIIVATESRRSVPVDKSLQNNIELQLLESQLLGRDDLVQAKLQRLDVINPNAEHGYLYRAWLAIRDDDAEDAERVLAEFKARYGETLTFLQLADYIALHTYNKPSMQQVALLAKTGRVKEAAQQFKTLLSNGFALVSSELEYLQILARVEGQRPAVIRRLRALNQQYPQVAPLRLALADQLLSENSDSEAGQAILKDLLDDPSLAQQALQRWLASLAEQPLGPNRLRIHTMLAERFPDNLAAIQAKASAIALQEEQRRLMRNPHYRARSRGLALLDAGNLQAAEKKLRYALAGRPQDAEVLGGLGLVYLRRGEHQRALNYFRDAERFNRDPDQQSRWRTLIDTAAYWRALRRGEALLERGQYASARKAFYEALSIQRAEVEPLIGLADLSRGEGDFAAADTFYRQVLSREALNTDALWGRIQLHRQWRGHDQAEQLYRRYSVEQQASVAELRTAWWRQQSAELLVQARASGDPVAVASALDALLEYPPLSPWQRLDAAQAMVELGDSGRADQYMAQTPRVSGDAEGIFAYALYLSSRGQRAQAVEQLRSIPKARRSDAMRSNLLRMEFEQAVAGLPGDDRQNRLQQLQDLQGQYKDSPDTRLRLAQMWWREGEEGRARELIQSLLPLASQSADRQQGVAELWLEMGELKAFERWYRPMRAKANRSGVDGPQLDALAARYAMAKGQYFAEREKEVLARRYYREAADIRGEHRAEALLALISLSGKSADTSAFAQHHQMLFAMRAELSAEQVLQAAAINTQYGKAKASKQWLALLPKRGDVSDQQLRTAMQQAIAAKDWSAAQRYAYAALQRAQGQPVDTALSEDARRQLYDSADREYWLGSSVVAAIDELRERQSGYIKAGIDLTERRSGTALQQMPIELRWPFPRYDGHAILRVDRVSIDSGQVDYLDPDGNTPPNITRIPFDESASGTAVGLGWQARNWQADIGTTPLGFTKENWVGGVSVRGKLGKFGWSATASRRPETGTALSYAGMTVPQGATGAGREWGGVLRSGLKFGLSYDLGGRYGYWSSAQFHQLHGDDVADNQRLALMGGVYRRIIAEENRNLRVGLNVMALSYDKNLSEYSLQHGAYYSPQKYLSLSIPVRYFGRVGENWSYLLGGAVSFSQSDEDPLYELATGGGGGGGPGYFLEAAIERRVSRHWYIGLAADIYRADFYEPNHASLYVKYQFDDRWQPIYTPPEPPIPYSDFD